MNHLRYASTAPRVSKRRRAWRCQWRAREWKRMLYAALTVHPCRYCGEPLDRGRATVDHFVPLARGGADHPRNFVLSCRECNAAKGAAAFGYGDDDWQRKRIADRMNAMLQKRQR